MVNFMAWAHRHNIPLAAVHELMHMLGEGFDSPQPTNIPGLSEAAVTSRVLLEAPSKNVILWRNQVGAFQDDTGRMVRFGLANDSKKMNERIKSHDYVGIRKLIITPLHVGHIVGQFVSREMKEAGWKFNMHDKHHAAQAKFGAIVNSYGGDAAFCTGTGSF